MVTTTPKSGLCPGMVGSKKALDLLVIREPFVPPRNPASPLVELGGGTSTSVSG